MDEMFISAPAWGDLLRGLLLPLGVMAVDYVGVTAAVVADLRSGLARARRQGVPLTSRGYRRTLTKLATYLRVLAGLSAVDGMLMASALCLRLTGGPEWPLLPVLTSLGSAGIALVEVKSMVENSGRKSAFEAAVDMLRRLAGAVKRMLP